MLFKILEKLNRTTEIAIMIFMVAISLITFIQVVFRYVFNNSLFWSEELGRYILIWITFLGAALGVNKGIHIGIDFVYNKLSEKNKLLLDSIINITGGTFGFLMLLYGIKLSYFVRMQKSSALLISMSWPYSAVGVAGALIFINYLLKLWGTVKELRESR